MGLAVRVIPTLLYRGEELVKGKQFNSWRSVGHVLQAARIHAARGVDELIVLDIGATPEGRGPNLSLVEKICEASFTPVTAGGGVRSVQDVRDLLSAGADKVAICSWAPAVVQPAARKFGSQAIVAAIDITGGRVAWQCGKAISTLSAVTMALKMAEEGAGEILLTSIDREGTMEGYDLDLIREVSSVVDCPVVAHGGAGNYQHLADGLLAGASAVAAGAMFQFTDQTPREAALYLAAQGIEARV